MVDAKTLRKQIRNVVQETLPDVLTAEMFAALEKKIMALVTERLDKIDQRQKEITSYMVRHSADPFKK